MTLDRRALLAGSLAALSAPRLARASTGARRFAVLRDGAEIGEHRIALARRDGALEVEIDIAIAVRILGITFYSYEMTNRERWTQGRLGSLDSRVREEGETREIRVRRGDGGLRVSGPAYDGTAPQDIATTTYFTSDFLDRPRWLSTDGGALLAVSTRRLGAAEAETASGAAQVTRWRVTDGADYTVDVDYDADGEWAGIGFDARGERATYRADTLSDPLSALWRGA